MIKEADYFIFNVAYAFKNGIAVVKQGEYWGEINHKGKWVTRIKCEKFTRINDNLIMIQINGKYGKYGCINNKGKWIIEPQYDSMFWYSDLKYFLVEKNGIYGTLSFENKLIIDINYKRLKIAEDKGKYVSAYNGKKSVF